MPRIFSREWESKVRIEGSGIRSRYRIGKVSPPVGKGVRGYRVRKTLSFVWSTPLNGPRDSAPTKQPSMLKWERLQRTNITAESSEQSEPAESTEQKPISQSTISKSNSPMSDTTEHMSSPITPIAPVYHFRMPRPGDAGALFFDKTNITEFLKRWEEECDEVRYTDAQKCVKLPAYCTKIANVVGGRLEGMANRGYKTMKLNY